MTIEIGVYRDADFDGVKSLWEEAFPDDPPWNRADAAIPAKIAAQPELFLVARDSERVIGSIMAGYDGHRGWLYAVAVRHGMQNKGVGALLVRSAEDRLKALGCSKINLQVRTSNVSVVAFYRRLGYAVEDRVSMGRRV